jgi:hypothetical protein
MQVPDTAGDVGGRAHDLLADTLAESLLQWFASDERSRAMPVNKIWACASRRLLALEEDRAQEWIPQEWWYFPLGENTPQGPFRWDQMLGWNLQDWLPPDLRMKPSGFRRAYRLAELFPGASSKVAFIAEPAFPRSARFAEAAPAQLALQNGTVAPDVVAEYRAAVEESDFDWRRILYVACERGAFRVVQWAIAIGADVNEEEEDLSCPAHAASGYGHSEVLRFLAEHDANLNKPDMDGWTPAHVASAKGNGEVLRELAARGADVNAVNEYNGRSVANVWKKPLP